MVFFLVYFAKKAVVDLPGYIGIIHNKNIGSVALLRIIRVLETTFTASAEAQIACWLGITKKRLLNEKSTYETLKEKKLLYQSDRLYQAIDPIIVMHLRYPKQRWVTFCSVSNHIDKIFLRRLSKKKQKSCKTSLFRIHSVLLLFD